LVDIYVKVRVCKHHCDVLDSSVFFYNFFLIKAIKYSFHDYIASSQHLGGWKNSQKLWKLALDCVSGLPTVSVNPSNASRFGWGCKCKCKHSESALLYYISTISWNMQANSSKRTKRKDKKSKIEWRKRVLTPCIKFPISLFVSFVPFIGRLEVPVMLVKLSRSVEHVTRYIPHLQTIIYYFILFFYCIWSNNTRANMSKEIRVIEWVKEPISACLVFS